MRPIDVKLTLNVRSQSDPTDAKQRVSDAVERRKSAESIEDAWARILTMKNSEADHKRLLAVKKAMEDGLIGRDPSSGGRRFSKAEALRLWTQVSEMQRAETLRRMVAETPANYRLITKESQLAELVQELRSEAEVAIDTETTGVDVYTDVIVGLSITLPAVRVIPATEIGKHVYIPVAHDEGEQLDRDYVLAELRDFLHDESIGKVAHNAIFDIAMFRRHGSDLRGVVWDTMTAMHMLNENEPSYRLKDLAPKYLGVEADNYDELFGKNAPFASVPLDIALVYAAKDTDLTWRLYDFQRRHLERMPTILHYYRTVEVPLLYVIVDLEANGYVLDMEYAREYGEQLRARAEELGRELIEELTPHHDGDDVINLNSSQQMRPALSRAIGVELPNMDAKKTLKPLVDKYEIIGKLLEYRKITKLSGTYIDALPTKQNPTTGRWHSRFNPMGTVTGRFSSGKDEESSSGAFNVQNQPDEARPMFVAPPGKVLVSADFKAQEIRCAAYLSGEPVLIDAFREERDPYATIASKFYGRPYEEVYKLPDGSDTPERKEFKIVWLATMYMMSAYSLGKLLGISKAEAQKFQDELFETMPKLSAWIDGNAEFVTKHGFVWADGQARKRRLPDAKMKRKHIPYGKWNDPKYEAHRLHNAAIGRALRQATNARVQGSSSIQTKVTMLRAWEYCRTRPGWALWATIHDELIFEIPDDFTRKDIEIIRDIMVNSYQFGEVPNGTDIEIMRRWGEGVSVDEWFRRKEDNE